MSWLLDTFSISLPFHGSIEIEMHFTSFCSLSLRRFLSALVNFRSAHRWNSLLLFMLDSEIFTLHARSAEHVTTCLWSTLNQIQCRTTLSMHTALDFHIDRELSDLIYYYLSSSLWVVYRITVIAVNFSGEIKRNRIQYGETHTLQLFWQGINCKLHDRRDQLSEMLMQLGDLKLAERTIDFHCRLL